jgi:hypothetical protein
VAVAQLWNVRRLSRFMRIISLMVFLAFLAGCKQPSPNEQRSPSELGELTGQIKAQAHLNHLIAHADRIMAVNGALEHSISGKSVKNVLRIMSSMKPCSPTDTAFEWELKFYRGTNILASVHIYGELLEIGDEQYCDDSGTLESLYYNNLAEREAGARLSMFQACDIAGEALAEKDVHSGNYFPPMADFDSRTGQWDILWLKRNVSEGFRVVVDDKTGNVLSAKRFVPDKTLPSKTPFNTSLEPTPTAP